MKMMSINSLLHLLFFHVNQLQIQSANLLVYMVSKQLEPLKILL